MEVYPIPTPGFLFLIASVMKLTFDHYETFGLTKVLQDLSFQEWNPVWGHIQLCKPRSDATERGILSGSAMFAKKSVLQISETRYRL